MTTFPNADAASAALVASVALIRQELAIMMYSGGRIDNALQILGDITIAPGVGAGVIDGTLDLSNASNSDLIAVIVA